MKKNTYPLWRKQDGFSLIGMAIGLMAIGLLVGAFMQVQKAYLQQKNQTKDRTLQVKITDSLAVYLQQNRAYPCPADATLTPDDPSFGTPDCGGGTVLQGTLPVRALNLPAEMAADIYGSKLTYAVTRARTNPATYNSSVDAITIMNDEGDSRSAPFVIVSHGPDRKGAYALYSTTITAACGTTAKDSENCNGDGTFLDGLYAPLANVGNSNHFDDSLTYSLAQQATTLWLISPADNGINIANRNSGNVGIGTNAPDSKLSIEDGNLHVGRAGSSAPGNIVADGALKANAGSSVHIDNSISATGNIYIKNRAQANETMRAKRYCYNIHLSDCD